jgi:hypothetical protein
VSSLLTASSRRRLQFVVHPAHPSIHHSFSPATSGLQRLGTPCVRAAMHRPPKRPNRVHPSSGSSHGCHHLRIVLLPVRIPHHPQGCRLDHLLGCVWSQRCGQDCLVVSVQLCRQWCRCSRSSQLRHAHRLDQRDGCLDSCFDSPHNHSRKLKQLAKLKLVS